MTVGEPCPRQTRLIVRPPPIWTSVCGARYGAICARSTDCGDLPLAGPATSAIETAAKLATAAPIHVVLVIFVAFLCPLRLALDALMLAGAPGRELNFTLSPGARRALDRTSHRLGASKPSQGAPPSHNVFMSHLVLDFLLLIRRKPQSVGDSTPFGATTGMRDGRATGRTTDRVAAKQRGGRGWQMQMIDALDSRGT